MSQMVLMYHPLLAETQGKPVLVALTSVDDWAARGWLLVDPEITPPTSSLPYFTRAETLSQVGAGTGPLGVALRAAFVTVVEHGANANAARPTDAVSVLWIGSVEPVNMAEGVDELRAVAA